MKTLISIFSIFILGLCVAMNVPAKANPNAQELTFDGYEGGYYFFTNEEQKAVVLEADEETKSPDLIYGSLEGKTFEVVYTPVSRTATSSTQGIIDTVNR